jgi:hypothetical protein
LLVLINPLIEVGLEEVHLLSVLQQPGPELRLELLLSQDQLDILVGVVDLALLLVNLGVEFELHVVGPLERVGEASEDQPLWLQLQLEVFGLDVRNVDREVDEVLCRLCGVGALSPENYGAESASAGLKAARAKG